MGKHLTFEQRYDQILFELNKRKRGYDFYLVPWEDAKQIAITRIWLKYHTFDEDKGPFPQWAQTVISSVFHNIWRDNLTVHSRPCILGCIWNAGGDQCERTKSGVQCAECPAYKIWENSHKKSRYSIKQPVALENHSQEVNNQQSDFLDIAAKKMIIDQEMKKRLDKLEWKVYKLLIIDGGTEEAAAKILGFKRRRGKKTRMYGGYLTILKLRHRFVDLAKQIIADENLA